MAVSSTYLVHVAYRVLNAPAGTSFIIIIIIKRQKKKNTLCSNYDKIRLAQDSFIKKREKHLRWIKNGEIEFI